MSLGRLPGTLCGGYEMVYGRATATKAIIIGGGIGGLTAAIALRQAGLDVVVLERREGLEEVHSGGGMVLWHNAIRALGELGLAEQMQAAGSRLEEMEWLASSGRRLASWPVAEMNETFGVGAIGVLRANIHPILTGALDEGVVQMGVESTGFSQDEGGATVQLADGREERGDIVIGADGIYSLVRAQLLGEEDPRYAGYALSFGVVEAQHELVTRNRFREYGGRGARFIYFPVGADRTYWSTIYLAAEGPSKGYGGSKEELLPIYSGWPEPIGTLIDATDESVVFRREIFDRKPVKRWGEGRVTLLGDAAHAMTPNLGQGACQAIEDAVVLGKTLGAGADPIEALRTYESRRIKRTNGFVNRSWMIGRLGCWKNPVACQVRDTIQRIVFPTVALHEQKKAMAYEF
jgi:2-polyprenyl-6-methoxyphenol hydroxylase-like FAD-dependent oxidoreductase